MYKNETSITRTSILILLIVEYGMTHHISDAPYIKLQRKLVANISKIKLNETHSFMLRANNSRGSPTSNISFRRFNLTLTNTYEELKEYIKHFDDISFLILLLRYNIKDFIITQLFSDNSQELKPLIIKYINYYKKYRFNYLIEQNYITNILNKQSEKPFKENKQTIFNIIREITTLLQNKTMYFDTFSHLSTLKFNRINKHLNHGLFATTNNKLAISLKDISNFVILSYIGVYYFDIKTDGNCISSRFNEIKIQEYSLSMLKIIDFVNFMLNDIECEDKNNKIIKIKEIRKKIQTSTYYFGLLLQIASYNYNGRITLDISLGRFDKYFKLSLKKENIETLLKGNLDNIDEEVKFILDIFLKNKNRTDTDVFLNKIVETVKINDIQFLSVLNFNSNYTQLFEKNMIKLFNSLNLLFKFIGMLNSTYCINNNKKNRLLFNEELSIKCDKITLIKKIMDKIMFKFNKGMLCLKEIFDEYIDIQILSYYLVVYSSGKDDEFYRQTVFINQLHAIYKEDL